MSLTSLTTGGWMMLTHSSKVRRACGQNMGGAWRRTLPVWVAARFVACEVGLDDLSCWL